jgi:hypothetical protein
MMRVDGTTAAELRKADARVRRALARGPRSAKELRDVARARASLWLEVVRVPPSGTWERRRADRYALAEHWIGPRDSGQAEGSEHLIRRYLGGFGPAALEDVSSWSGVPAPQLEIAAAGLRLRRFRDERGQELLDLPGASLPPAGTASPVRFLPRWDAILLVHARRAGVMPEEYRPIVFATKNPPSVPTFLVDGRVAGAWRYEDGRVELEPYERLSRTTERELRAEAKRLSAFMNGGG